MDNLRQCVPGVSPPGESSHKLDENGASFSFQARVAVFSSSSGTCDTCVRASETAGTLKRLSISSACLQ